MDPAHQDLLFPDLSLEDPDLESIMGDEISLEMKTMILVAVKESHAKNQQMVQLMDTKARSLYSSAAGLVNDGVETLRGFGKVQTALDIRLQSILRRSGPFVRDSCTSLAGVKLLKDKGVMCAFSSGNNVAKKKRSQGSRRKAQGPPPGSLCPGASSWRLSWPGRPALPAAR